MNSKTTFAKHSICSATAQRMIAAAEQKAAELGLCIATAVVDESGILKAFSRMDGAPLVAVGVSMKKGVTAVGFGMATGKPWHDFVKDDPILLHGVQSIDQFTMLGGGLPIHIDGQLVGAVGVSGGHYSKDEECARAALAVLESA
jgi:uncharacterized protein GlcG (DUF336 family)